jgi:hypothetical protein
VLTPAQGPGLHRLAAKARNLKGVKEAAKGSVEAHRSPDGATP